jgi:hypothetical protein
MKTFLSIVLMSLLISCQKTKFNPEHPAQKGQEDVLSRDGIDSVLSTLTMVAYSKLPIQYLDYSHPNRKFEPELQERDFYCISGFDINKKIVGNFTVRNFLAHDEYYKMYKDNPYPEFEQYWLIDKKVLYMMLELITELKDEGYNEYGFHIRNSHRHPKLNTDANGAKYSQHMFGKAIDIGVEDINQDGRNTQADKIIVYDILEKIVDNNGGLGKYPGSMNLHFDCRGFKARWDYP